MGITPGMHLCWILEQEAAEVAESFFSVHSAISCSNGFWEQAKDTKSSVEEIFNVINNPNYAYTLTPEKVQKNAEFMYRIGTIKVKPASWKEMFFPEVHNLGGD